MGWKKKKKYHTEEARAIIKRWTFIIKQEHMDKKQDKLNLFGWIQHSLQYYIHLNLFNKHFRNKKN